MDLDVRSGTSRIALSFPHILGREFAGEVAAIGGPASPFKEGDRVWVSCRIPCAPASSASPAATTFASGEATSAWICPAATPSL